MWWSTGPDRAYSPTMLSNVLWKHTLILLTWTKCHPGGMLCSVSASQLQDSCIHPEFVLLCGVQHVPPTSQKHGCKWISYASLYIGIKKCANVCNVMDGHSIRRAFLPGAWHSRSTWPLTWGKQLQKMDGGMKKAILWYIILLWIVIAICLAT